MANARRGTGGGVGVTATLSFRLGVILSSSILLLFAIHAFLTQRFESAAIETTMQTSAWRASEFIRQSLYSAMLRNERDRIHEMIRLYGSEPGVDVVRIYN